MRMTDEDAIARARDDLVVTTAQLQSIRERAWILAIRDGCDGFARSCFRLLASEPSIASVPRCAFAYDHWRGHQTIERRLRDVDPKRLEHRSRVAAQDRDHPAASP